MATWQNVNALYQIYPRSFKDTNGDGIGDIQGIIAQLDYIKTLADAIWISPLYASPQKDFGYDVSSYTDIAPEYGTLADFDQLVHEVHARGMRLFMDFVPSHTSDQHEWFKESRSSRTNPKRDWYVWRDGRPDGGAPNNWLSFAGGPTWTLDAATGQYYLHSWTSYQPDLNWDNPEVREAMHAALRFWLERGVDGFRVDAVWGMSKDETYADDPVHDPHSLQTFGGYRHVMCRNGKHLYEYLGGMAQVVQRYGGLLILEYYASWEFGNPFEQLYAIQSINPVACTAFFFDPMEWELGAAKMGQGIADYLAGLPAGVMPVFCFGNHDQPRIVSRYGGEPQARLIAVLQLTLPGLPSIYNGEELGMHNGYVPTEQRKDIFNIEDMATGRDPERTPMHWTDGANAGFSTGTPWLPVDESYADVNAERQHADPRSFLALYRRLLALRREHQGLRDGPFTLLGYDNNILAYQIAGLTIYINFNTTKQPVDIHGSMVCSSIDVSARHSTQSVVELQPYEAIVVKGDKQ